MSDWERQHIVSAYRFELGKVTDPRIRERVVGHLTRIDHQLATAVAAGIGVPAPEPKGTNHGRRSPALSQADTPRETILGRKIAFLLTDGVDLESVTVLRDALTARGATVELLAPIDGQVTTADGATLPVTRAMTTVASVLYDAVVIPAGEAAALALTGDGYAVHFVAEAYKHAKPIGVLGGGLAVFSQAGLSAPVPDRTGVGRLAGVVVQSAAGPASDEFVTGFVEAVAGHRHFDRPLDVVPA
jgi:catalase